MRKKTKTHKRHMRAGTGFFNTGIGPGFKQIGRNIQSKVFQNSAPVNKDIMSTMSSNRDQMVENSQKLEEIRENSKQLRIGASDFLNNSKLLLENARKQKEGKTFW